jgi:hypothetical protein
MQQDLAVAKSLGDIAGECRAHGNLGSAYFSKGSFKEALTSHRYQLVLAMKCRDTQAAAAALTSLGQYDPSCQYDLVSHCDIVQVTFTRRLVITQMRWHRISSVCSWSSRWVIHCKRRVR